MRSLHQFAVASVLGLALAVGVRAAEPGSTPEQNSSKAGTTAPNKTDGSKPEAAKTDAAAPAVTKIRIGDVLDVRVSGMKELSGKYPVDAKGEITLPGIGTAKVTGQAEDECAAALTKLLANFVEPGEVTVVISAEKQAVAYVRGLVAPPNTVVLTEGARVLEVLARAGKVDPNGDLQRVRLLHTTGEETVLDLTAILRDPASDVVVKNGETILILPVDSGSVQIRGAVQVAGPVLIREAPRLKPALERAKLTANADVSRVSLLRKGTSIPYLIDLSSVLKTAPAAQTAATPAATATPAAPAAGGAATATPAAMTDEGPELKDGDVIEVPTLPAPPAPVVVPRVRITGAVKKKEASYFDLSSTPSVLDLIDQAGGLDEQADTAHIQILRAGKDPLYVNVQALQRGVGRVDGEQLLLQDGDHVFVPLAMVELRGEVTTPGEKPLKGVSNVLEFLTNNGGAKPTGDLARVQIVRDGQVARIVNLTQYAATAYSPYTAPELELRAGDTVFVPSDESQRFVVLGAVNKPGDYRALPGMTLVDALSLSDGLTKKAATELVVIRNARSVTSGKALDKAIYFVRLATHEDADGVVRIRYRRLENGRKPENPVIQPGDAVLVPEASQMPQKLNPTDYAKKALSLILTIKGAKKLVPLLFPL